MGIDEIDEKWIFQWNLKIETRWIEDKNVEVSLVIAYGEQSISIKVAKKRID